MNDFVKFIEELCSKDLFYSSMTGKKLVIAIISMVLKFGVKVNV